MISLGKYGMPYETTIEELADEFAGEISHWIDDEVWPMDRDLFLSLLVSRLMNLKETYDS